ncbi:ribonuclease domain-containing protein [Actinacidiphila soli]|uniref:ribonuclease domain-containing protein n=1 Tax=Actinacidiphila soli TaxID=2487275 RepID=UPI000FCB0627|nr:ribonuclease domain-containing protein [Actinacidiphila soli]
MSPRSVPGALLACLLLLIGGCAAQGSDTGTGPTAATTTSVTATAVGETQLPAEARATLKLIDAGGPFPYAKDGAVFGNFEGLLPGRKRGYYHEYTVRTPGERDRGARRMVTGEGGEYYYTDDHYGSFKAVLR